MKPKDRPKILARIKLLGEMVATCEVRRLLPPATCSNLAVWQQTEDERISQLSSERDELLRSLENFGEQSLLCFQTLSPYESQLGRVV